MAEDAKIGPVRERFLKKYNGSILDDTYDERDVTWVKTSDPFVRNVVKAFKTGGDVEKCVDLINEILLFRAKMKLNDLKESDLHPEVRQLEGVYFHGKDKEGHPVMIFEVRKQKKGWLVEEGKKNIAYQMNKHYMASPEVPLVTIFDFTGAGVTNMDLDISKYIITCLGTYFPGLGVYNLMFKMHPALEAIWAIIKVWLDSDQTKNTHYVKKKNIQQYIEKDQLLPHMIKEEKPAKK